MASRYKYIARKRYWGPGQDANRILTNASGVASRGRMGKANFLITLGINIEKGLTGVDSSMARLFHASPLTNAKHTQKCIGMTDTTKISG